MRPVVFSLIFSLLISSFGDHIHTVSGVAVGQQLPVENGNEEQDQPHPFKGLIDSLEMVPVSSTVIPVTSLFGTSKPESFGVGTVQGYPLFRSSYSRRSNFFDKSTKPGTPVRLITTRSHKARILAEANDG